MCASSRRAISEIACVRGALGHDGRERLAGELGRGHVGSVAQSGADHVQVGDDERAATVLGQQDDRVDHVGRHRRGDRGEIRLGGAGDDPAMHGVGHGGGVDG